MIGIGGDWRCGGYSFNYIPCYSEDGITYEYRFIFREYKPYEPYKLIMNDPFFLSDKPHWGL